MGSLDNPLIVSERTLLVPRWLGFPSLVRSRRASALRRRQARWAVGRALGPMRVTAAHGVLLHRYFLEENHRPRPARCAQDGPRIRPQRFGWTRGDEAVASGDRRHRRTGQVPASLAVSEEDVDGASAQAARRRTIGWLLWPSKYSTSSTVLARPPSRIGAAGLAHVESAGHRARGSQRGAWFPGGTRSCTS